MPAFCSACQQVTLASETDVEELFRQALPVVRVTVCAPEWAAAQAEEAEARKAAKKEAKEAEKRAAWRAKLEAKAANGDARAKAKLAALLARQAGNQPPPTCDPTQASAEMECSSDEEIPAGLPKSAPPDGAQKKPATGGSTEAAADTAEEVAVHPGITCDGCDMCPLLGHRFKSMDRPDFDVCEGCKAREDAYWARDTFVLIERPCLWRGCGSGGPSASRGPPWRNGPPGAGRAGRHCPGPRGMPPMPMHGFHGPPPGAHRCRPNAVPRPYSHGPHPHHPPPHHPPPPFLPGPPGAPFHPPPPFHHAPPPMSVEDSAEFGEGAEQPPGKAAKPEARFVLDVTLPDGAELQPAQQLTKTWRMRNSGSAPWAPSGGDLLLLHVGGDQLAAKPVTRLACQPPGPGQEVDVSVDLVAPSQPGRYVGYFRLAEEGVERHQRFGQRVWASILVPPPAPTQARAPADEERLMKERSETLASYTEVVGLKALPEQYLPPEIVQQANANVAAAAATTTLYPVPVSMPGPSTSTSGAPSSNVDGDEWIDIPKAHES